MLKKYAYYRMLLCLLVKHNCKNLRREDSLLDNSSVMIERDNAETLKAEFDMEIQSEPFGFTRTISIEEITCEYHNKYQNCERNQ